MPAYCTTDWGIPDPYRVYNECTGQAQQVREYMEDLLYRNTVDIVFHAHAHNYERDTAIYQNQSYGDPRDHENLYVDSKAPIYILSGCAGNKDRHNDPISKVVYSWTRFLSEKYGVGEFVVFNSTHAYFQQWSTYDNEVIDWVWIVKNNHRYL